MADSELYTAADCGRRNGDRKEEILRIFPRGLREILGSAGTDFGRLQEIRLRTGRPLMIVSGGREWFLEENGRLTAWPERAHVVSREEMVRTVECMGNYSLYAFEEEIRQGFLTMPGGHRVGLAGKAVSDEKGIRTIRYISFLNIRLAHQIKGCADPVMPYLQEDGQVFHTLIISPPRCGKTTLLRDVIRQLSDGILAAGKKPGDRTGGKSRNETAGRGFTVGVVDERSELAACCGGVPQNDLGIRTDVLDCCPKALGMMMLVRSMSPDVIAVDEIGGLDDLEAVRYVMNCGCRLVATVHGSSLEDAAEKPVLRELVRERVFQRYIVLSGRKSAGTVEEILDENGRLLYGEAMTGKTASDRAQNRKDSSFFCGDDHTAEAGSGERSLLCG